MADVLGTAAALSAYGVEYGMARQVWSNYKRRSCENLDSHLFILVALGYTLWTSYGWLKSDWYLFWSNLPGVVVAVVLCWQMWAYRK
jgi:uncharacterized protein with PQ loop repeat